MNVLHLYFASKFLKINSDDPDQTPRSAQLTRPRGYKTFSKLNSTEHEFLPAHKC